jgi:hypothetical protein
LKPKNILTNGKLTIAAIPEAAIRNKHDTKDQL